MFEKFVDKVQKDNDIYFLEVINDIIIINNNYKGIEILDSSLNLIKKIDIFKDMVIYSSFVNRNQYKILLFCPDNECLVLVNLYNYASEVIPLKGNLEDVIFSSIYCWEDSSIILSSYDGHFYNVNLDNKNY